MSKENRQIHRIGKTSAGGQLGGTTFGQMPGAVKGNESRGGKRGGNSGRK